MLIGVVSIGGTPLAYGNVFDGSWKFGNFVAEYLCQYLRDNSKHQIDILYFQETDELSNIFDKCNKYDVLFFALDLVNYNIVKNYINNYINENIVSALFGHLTSSYYEEILNEINTNYCLIGDPEEPSVRLINSLESKIDLSNDLNIANRNNYLKKEKNICTVINRPRCYDYYENDTLENNIRKTHCLALKNQVCAYNCSFCWSNKGKYIYKDINKIVNEIKYVALKFKVKDFYFTDNDILDYKNINEYNIILNLFQEIINLKLKLSIFVFCKSKSININNIPLLKKMKEAGVYCIFIGIDAGNNEDLKLYRKASNLDHGYNAIKILKELNIWYRFGLIGINPYSSVKSISENYNFLDKVHCTNYNQYCGMKVMLFKNTPLYYQAKNDLLLTDNYSFKTFYGYKFKNKEINAYLNVFDDINSKISMKDFTQFYVLKNQYEKTKAVVKLNDDNIVENIEEKLYKVIHQYFELIFKNNDLLSAKDKEEQFINEIYTISSNNRTLFRKYKKIYNSIMN